MNKIHFALIFTLFTILIANILGTQDAFAVTKTYVGGDNSDWDVAIHWDPRGVPDQDDDIVIIAQGALRVNINSDVTIGPSGSITTDLGSVIRAVNPGSLTIQGTYTMNNLADALVARGGTIENDCTGIITLAEGVMFTQTFSGNGGTIINHGTITGTRLGGSSNQDNSIFLLSGGLLQNSGTLPSAILVNDGATFETILSSCFTDADGDGFDPNVDDCNDDDASIHPGAEEVLDDGIDQDCDGFDLTAVDISGKFAGKFNDNFFSSRGKFMIDGEKFKHVKSSGNYNVKEKVGTCNLITINNGIWDFGNENTLIFEAEGENCSKKFFKRFSGTFTVIGGSGIFENAEGEGEINLINGRKHFLAKLSGTLGIPEELF